eukprot:15593087-Heterocapsa_arctica.AAC.1
MGCVRGSDGWTRRTFSDATWNRTRREGDAEDCAREPDMVRMIIAGDNVQFQARICRAQHWNAAMTAMLSHAGAQQAQAVQAAAEERGDRARRDIA